MGSSDGTHRSRWTRTDAEALVQRIRRDSSLLSSFRLAYADATDDGGGDDPVDVLEWFANPNADASSGAHNPADRLPALHRRVYGRSGTIDADADADADRRRAEVELDELRQRQSARARALEAALSAVLAPVGTMEEFPKPQSVAGQPLDRDSPARRWREALTGCLAIAAVVLTIQAAVPPPLSLKVFDRNQTPQEAALEQSLSRDFRPADGSVRILMVDEPTSFLAFTSALGILPAIAGLESVCLVAEQADRFTAAGCSSIDGFGMRGLLGTIESGGRLYEFRWGPRGGLSLTTTSFDSQSSGSPAGSEAGELF